MKKAFLLMSVLLITLSIACGKKGTETGPTPPPAKNLAYIGNVSVKVYNFYNDAPIGGANIDVCMSYSNPPKAGDCYYPFAFSSATNGSGTADLTSSFSMDGKYYWQVTVSKTGFSAFTEITSTEYSQQSRTLYFYLQ